jgi:hypothetical protein
VGWEVRATHLPRVSRGYYCVRVSFAALLWIALLQALVPAGQPTRADRVDVRGPRAWAAVLVGPEIQRSARAVARPGRTVRAAPAFAERHHTARPSLANTAAHLPRSKGGLPKGVAMGSSGTKTGASWALIPVVAARELAQLCGTEETSADHTSRVAAARGRLLSYLPNPPPRG